MSPRLRSVLARFDGLLTLLLAVAALGLIFVYLPTDARRTFSGPARVVDGDTLVIGNVTTRLKGIDAPETGQFCYRNRELWRCGADAAIFLQSQIAGRNVTCDGEGRDQYDRILAVCRVGDRDLNREMVANGWAVAYGGYDAEERSARQEELGIWASQFDRPSNWRSMFEGT